MTGVLHNALPFRAFVFDRCQQGCFPAGNLFFPHHREFVCERVDVWACWAAELACGGGGFMHHACRITTAGGETLN